MNQPLTEFDASVLADADHKTRAKSARCPVVQLSFVIPAYNEEENIGETIVRVAAEATRLKQSFEILIVDDGSQDETFSRARDMGRKFPVRVLRLSRNFGKEHAISAGLERSLGQAVIILDADLQEPISYLEEMLRHYDDGYEMVYAVRLHRQDESRAKRIFTKNFYRLLSFGSEFDIPADARDFRLMDRRVVDVLNALPERNRFMKGLYGWVGFRTKAMPIELATRAGGTTKFGFKGLMRLGLTGLTSFTNWPLRIWTAIGSGFALLSILYGLWIVAKTLIWGVDVPGFATITAAIFFLGGVQLISIGIIGEYLARVFTEVKGRPGFIVAEEPSPEAKDGRAMSVKQASRFAIVGGAATLCHMAVGVVLISGGTPALLANLLAFLTAFLVSFLGHFFVSFRAPKARISIALPRFAIVAGLGFAANTLVLAGLVATEILPAEISLVISTGIAAVLTYVLSRSWAFAT